MTKEELIELYPEKTFTQGFAEKKTAFISLGSNREEFSGKERSLSGLFKYDDDVRKLEELLHKKNTHLDAADSKEAERHFRRIIQLNELLNTLSAQDPRNISMVFERFDRELRGMGLTGSVMVELSSGTKVASSDTMIDLELWKLEKLRERISPEKAAASPAVEFDIDKLKQAEELVGKIISDSEKYQKAANTAENWIETEGRAAAAAIQNKSKIFNDKAKEEHAGWRVWLWLVAATALAFVTIWVATFFVYELQGQHDISVGLALLRITVIATLSYAAFIAYQQFNIQRRLYESYKFKAIALSTMEELLKTYSDPNDRESILTQAISIIFSEPTMKEEKAVQQRLIDELLDVVKKKI